MQTTPEGQQPRSASGALRHFHEDGLELRLIPTLIWGELSLCLARRRWALAMGELCKGSFVET